MFSGIVEAKAKVLSLEEKDSLLRIQLERPARFEDLQRGDSICCNGVCLTIEEFTADKMQFAIAAETLKVTSWTAQQLLKKNFNLERSLKFGDRIHGHLVSGHVEAMAELLEKYWQGESLILRLQLPESFRGLAWSKGSLCLNGVSLTINSLVDQKVEFCLIPETLERTNLNEYEVGEKLCVEPDMMAKAIQAHVKEHMPKKDL